MNKMKCFLSKKMLLAVVVLLSVGYVQAQEAKDIVLLTLDKALEIALSENPTMKVAGQEIQLKKEAKKEAYGGLFDGFLLADTKKTDNGDGLWRRIADHPGRFGQLV